MLHNATSSLIQEFSFVENKYIVETKNFDQAFIPFLPLPLFNALLLLFGNNCWSALAVSLLSDLVWQTLASTKKFASRKNIRVSWAAKINGGIATDMLFASYNNFHVMIFSRLLIEYSTNATLIHSGGNKIVIS